MLDEHRTRLLAAGIDAHGCEACGQLEVLPWHQAYLTEDGRFDKEQMLARGRAQSTRPDLPAGLARTVGGARPRDHPEADGRGGRTGGAG